MIKQVLAEGRCPPWVTGDEVSGRDTKLRAFLEGQRTRYVLKITCSFRLALIGFLAAGDTEYRPVRENSLTSEPPI